ncbi:MAG: HD domain-containing phosphohydrolase [Arcobacteraceae bacterium]
MNIKKIIKFSFVIIAFFVLIIGSISALVMYQIKENTASKKHISKLVLLQEDMNSKIKDLMLANTQEQLNNIKKEFVLQEHDFEDTRDAFITNNEDDFIDNFIVDIHQHDNILLDLKILFANEKEIEKKFDKLYDLQKDKIEFEILFKKIYAVENNMRKDLEKTIERFKNLETTKAFGYLQYYSKETLYQHKDQKTLQKWLNQITILYNKHDIDELKEYMKIVTQIGSYIININNITKQEKELQNNILQIIEKNQMVNTNIENNIEKLASNFINNVYMSLFILLCITMLIIIIFGRKVYKNVGLSVDEIESKIQHGLEQINQLNEEITNTQKEVVFTMGAIGESRSKETGNHVKRVAEYSKILALKYGLSQEEAEMIKQASPMHDIGKVAIPDAVLNKPGRFDEEERKIMDTHAKLGFDMLNSSNRPLLKLAATVAYEHHEKWDGSGYPQGLKGESINIAGRITALADVFDALGSDRVYKKAWEDERIFNLFKEERAKHFDPKLVDIFFENLDEFLKIRDKFKDIE